MLRMGVFLVSVLGFLAFLVFSCGEKNNEKAEITSADSLIRSAWISPMECRPCHAAVVDSFMKTGKGRSMYPAATAPPLEDWTVSPVYDRFRNFYYLPRKVKEGDYRILEFRLEEKDTVHKLELPIDFFIGSGNQTRSYLVNRNGYLYEMPLTWYRQKGIWDLSPGYEKGGNERFSRAVGTECMACHAAGFEADSHSINHFRNVGQALDCGSCHGDMKAHLENAKAGKPVQKDLLRLGKIPLKAQLDVCRQCHLEGVKVRKRNAAAGDYAPGKNFSDFYEVFVPSTGEQDFGFASHAERLQLSACFKGSKGKMNCQTCHDPHAAGPADQEKAIANTCASCHGPGHEISCSGVYLVELKETEEEKNQNCVSCHMARGGTNDIPHVSSHDHWIRKVPAKRQVGQGKIRFGHFAGTKVNQADKAAALLQYAESRNDSAVFAELGAYLKFLTGPEQLKYAYLTQKTAPEFAVTASDRNPWNWFYQAEIRKRKGEMDNDGYLNASRLAPWNMDFAYRLALSKQESGTTASEAYAALLKKMPFHVLSLSNLGFAKLQEGKHAEALILLQKALTEEPDFVLARENLARCYMEMGRFSESRNLLQRLIREFPDEIRYQQVLQALP